MNFHSSFLICSLCPCIACSFEFTQYPMLHKGNYKPTRSGSKRENHLRLWIAQSSHRWLHPGVNSQRHSKLTCPERQETDRGQCSRGEGHQWRVLPINSFGKRNVPGLGDMGLTRICAHTPNSTKCGYTFSASIILRFLISLLKGCLIFLTLK